MFSTRCFSASSRGPFDLDPAYSHFPARRVGHLTSNFAESCNAMMNDIRKLFPFNALNAFLDKTSQLFIERLQQHSAATTALPHNVLTKIKDAVKRAPGLPSSA